MAEAFQFSVEIGGIETRLMFTEVSGLQLDAQPIEYRTGANRVFAPTRLSGPGKFGTITLKRGLFTRNPRLIEWLASANRDNARRQTVTIRLLDERGVPTMTWSLTNAWPAKVVAPDLEAGGNEVAVDSLELSHEGLTVASS